MRQLLALVIQIINLVIKIFSHSFIIDKLLKQTAGDIHLIVVANWQYPVVHIMSANR